MTIDQVVRASGLPRNEALILLAHVLSRPRAWLLAHGHDVLDAQARGRFQALCARRCTGEPVAYLTGRRAFWTLDLEVSPAVLIPRPETELLVERALAAIPVTAPVRVADLGTGSGAIALAIASERPAAWVVATDRSMNALALARRNASRHAIGNVSFACAGWLAAFADRSLDVVVSNPPYVAAEDPHLGRGDLRFEPAAALASGPDGLDALRAIVPAAARALRPGGSLLVEHGSDQGAAVRALFAAHGFRDVGTSRDLASLDRVTAGTYFGS